MSYAARIAALPLPHTDYVIGVEGDGYSQDRLVGSWPAYTDDQIEAMRKDAAAVAAEADSELSQMREMVAKLGRDAARLDWLEQEMEREREAIRYHRPPPDSLFRRNMPITRAAIDAAINKESA